MIVGRLSTAPLPAVPAWLCQADVEARRTAFLCPVELEAGQICDLVIALLVTLEEGEGGEEISISVVTQNSHHIVTVAILE
jgi:hypothetical protein